jgi:hypothetical protein
MIDVRIEKVVFSESIISNCCGSRAGMFLIMRRLWKCLVRVWNVVVLGYKSELQLNDIIVFFFFFSVIIFLFLKLIYAYFFIHYYLLNRNYNLN